MPTRRRFPTWLEPRRLTFPRCFVCSCVAPVLLLTALSGIVMGTATAIARAWTPTSRASRTFRRRVARGSDQPRPLQVSATSLLQQGRKLVWTLQLSEAFSPGGLAKDGRTLCLLLERAANGSVSGQVCLASGGPGGGPRLVFERVTAAGAGSGTVIAARITRSSSSQLTGSFAPSQVGIGYKPLRWQVISTLARPACAAPHTARTDCYLLFPVQPELLALRAPHLIGCVPSGPSEVRDGSSTTHELALTFDDGPWSTPPSIDFVDLLAREHVPATFFEIGEHIPEFDTSGAVERAMLADGDMIGDHTWTHPNMTLLSASRQASELELTAEAIRARTGFTPCLWRPPYGDVDQQVIALARSLGFLTILWDVDPADWALPGSAMIYQRVVSHAHNGAIVIQHFGGGPRYETLAALPREIATLRTQGYRFVTVTQLLGLRLIYR